MTDIFDGSLSAQVNRSAAPQRLVATAHVLGACLASVLLLLASPAAADPCDVPDAGSGTVELPPAGCDYLSPTEVHLIIDGLPPGTTIEFAPIHKDFICGDPRGLCTAPPPAGFCEGAGGSLGGNADCADSTLEFEVTGTGALAGFSRFINMQAFFEVHTGPRTPGAAVQDFDTEMVQLQADLFGDPDFDFLQIRAGSIFGLPSPGHTTLTRLGPPGSDFAVDSFFDITYTIEFQGAPGSILDGLGGLTQATLRMQAGDPAPPSAIPALQPWQGVVLGLSILCVGGGRLFWRRRVEVV